jgi:hypothetical protein
MEAALRPRVMQRDEAPEHRCFGRRTWFKATGEERFPVGPGGYAFGLRGISHGFRNDAAASPGCCCWPPPPASISRSRTQAPGAMPYGACTHDCGT